MEWIVSLEIVYNRKCNYQVPMRISYRLSKFGKPLIFFNTVLLNCEYFFIFSEFCFTNFLVTRSELAHFAFDQFLATCLSCVNEITAKISHKMDNSS